MDFSSLAKNQPIHYIRPWHQVRPKFHSCAKHCNLKHPVTKYARAARKFFLHRMAKKNWSQGDGHIFLEKPEFCASSTPQISQLCQALQFEVSSNQICAHSAQFFLQPRRRSLVAA